MKAKTTKKALSLFLSLLMIFSVMSSAFSVSAADCDHEALKDDPSVVWEIVRPTSCRMEGSKKTSCPICHETVTAAIPIDPNAHVLGPWQVTVVNSCEREGQEVRICIECNTTRETRPIPKHNFKRLYGESATCMVAGYEFVMCTSCFAMETRTLPIDTSAHVMGEWIITKEATCVNGSGERTRFCLNCDLNGNRCPQQEKEAYSDPENHVNIVWDPSATVEPTCYSDGYVPGICSDCKERVKDPIPQHSQVEYQVLSSNPATCVTEGSEKRRCTGCGLEYDVVLPIDPDKHVSGEWIIEKEASCVNGLRSKGCIYHPTADRVEEILPANGKHNFGEWETTIEPNCSMTGLRVKKCADCSETITEELPTKHNYLDWTEVKVMNCDETKLQQGSKLAKCNDCNFEKYFIVPTLHTYGLWVITKASDCESGNEGEMERFCLKCGKKETKTYVQEHDFCEWFVSEVPTCAKDGLSGKEGKYTRYCKVCATEENITIPVTHEFGEWEIIKYPVHTMENGLLDEEKGSKVRYCKFCDAEEKAEIVPEHVFGEWVVTQESTCTEKGEKVRKCFVCGFEETAELPVEHTYGNYDLTSIYNCGDKAKGNEKLVRVCTKCGQSDDYTLAQNYSGHPNLKVVVIEPTCTTSGYTSTYCPDCMDTAIISDIVDPLGHELDENWTIVGNPSCTAKGSSYKACANCDYLETVYFDKTEHVLIVTVPGVEPTCTTPGSTPEAYCAVCKATFSSQPLPANGHKYDDGSEICKICKAYKDTDNCTCDCHSTSGIGAIIFRIIRTLYQMIGINQYCKCGVAHYDEVGFLGKLFGRG